MTKMRAGRITGYEVRPVPVTHPKAVAFGLFDGDTEICHISGSDEKDALGKLVNLNYQRVSKLVMERAKWRCKECGSFNTLQVHHKVFRSHGRRDVEENLKCLCWTCHSKAHGTSR